MKKFAVSILGKISNFVNLIFAKKTFKRLWLPVVGERKLAYICTAFSGRGEIGRRARLRIWCLAAWGFESLRPHNRNDNRLALPVKDKQAVC